jgi:hypothetical protein
MTLTIMKTMFFVTNNVHMIYFNKSVEQFIFNVIQKVLHINNINVLYFQHSIKGAYITSGYPKLFKY